MRLAEKEELMSRASLIFEISPDQVMFLVKQRFGTDISVRVRWCLVSACSSGDHSYSPINKPSERLVN